MDDLQGIHDYYSILDVTFDLNSYEMDDKEMQNHTENTFSWLYY